MAEKLIASSSETQEQETLNQETIEINKETDSNNLQTDLNNLQTNFNNLQTDFNNLQTKYTQLEKTLEKKNEELLFQQKKIDDLKKKLTVSNLNIETKIKEKLEHFLTSNQLDILLKKKIKARWTSDELSQAFTIRYFSRGCYVYLRKQLNYPLPGISTLQHWAANINLRTGILEDVIKIMDIYGKLKSERNRVAVLSFDEVKISSVYEYDQKEDEVIGPYSYMQVIMARGVFENWKQPVFIDFDCKVTKAILSDIIKKLYHINYNVVACVSDCGGGNQGLWKELNINQNKTYYLHPVTNDKVYFFADAPHLLKLTRNWFLDHGFILNDGTIINKNPVVSLINENKSEISSCHKLSDLHLNCEKSQRQNVTLAAQLFSNMTATALKMYKPGENKQLAYDVGLFIEQINDWFDIMNSYVPHGSIPNKEPYGRNLEMQSAFLDKMKKTISTMRCISKNSPQIFQKGFILSISSLQDLFLDLREKYNIEYILTHRLNQDCLENFFSQVIL